MPTPVRDRLRRRVHVRNMSMLDGYVEWCKDKLFVREDGVERPATVSESLEFIIYTSENSLQVTPDVNTDIVQLPSASNPTAVPHVNAPMKD